MYTAQNIGFGDCLKMSHMAERVVLELKALVLNQRYHMTISNWFPSPDLHDKLYSKHTNSMATLHQNRKLDPVKMNTEKLKKKENMCQSTMKN